MSKASQIIRYPNLNSLGLSWLLSNRNWLNPNPVQIPLPKSLCENPFLVRASKKTSDAAMETVPKTCKYYISSVIYYKDSEYLKPQTP